MNEEILKDLYDFYKANKHITKDYVEKVVGLCVDQYNLGKYVKKVQYMDLNPNNKDSLAGYAYEPRLIILFTDKLADMILTKEDYIPGNQLLFCKNVKITQSLLHEIEHAKQAKIMDERKDDEAEILKVTGTSKSQEVIRDRLTSLGMGQSIIKVILNNKLKICADYYNFGPHERLAEINSNEKMLEIIDPLKNFTPNVYNLINAGFASNRVRGYKLNNQLISPTIYFLKKQEEYALLRKFEWYDERADKALEKSRKKYNLEKRVRLGLPISEYEYVTEEDNLKKVLSKIRNQ